MFWGSWYAFFFQAEDGIRDDLVTGVQTCALPICLQGQEAILHAGWYVVGGFRLFGVEVEQRSELSKSENYNKRKVRQ